MGSEALELGAWFVITLKVLFIVFIILAVSSAWGSDMDEYIERLEDEDRTK